MVQERLLKIEAKLGVDDAPVDEVGEDEGGENGGKDVEGKA